MKFQNLLLIAFLVTPGAINAAPDGTTPPEVISRLVDNASKEPLGSVENDVTEQTIKTVKAMAKAPMLKDHMGSLRESIAAEYNEFTIEGPMTSLYSEGPVALFYGKVKLTAAAIADHKDDGDSPMFGDSGAFSCWVGPKVKDDGHVIATFCMVQQEGLWKVHGVYLSNDVIDGTNKTFIVNQLTAFGKKQ